MMSHNGETGHLSEDMTAWVRSFREKHRQLLEDCKQLNRLGYKVLLNLNVDTSSQRQVLVSALFARALEFYQAIMTVLDRGLATAPHVLSRALLEAVFTACAIAKDDETLRLYIRNDELYRLKLARKARQLSSAAPPKVKEIVTDELIDELKKTIKDEGIVELTVEELAKRAGLHEVYLTGYAAMTSPAHSLVRDLEEYIVVDKSGKGIDALRVSVPDADSITVLPLSGLLVLQVLEAVGTSFHHLELQLRLADGRDASRLRRRQVEPAGGLWRSSVSSRG